ncbi:MAG: hypothetical protein KA369_12115 [Spirochaetes bacterium]|nr:hypothetical protein [Spirochaetota bacterium]
MVSHYKRAASVLGVLLISCSLVAISGEAAPKKNKAAPKKTAAAKTVGDKRKEASKTAVITKDRVLKEFNAVYKDPPESRKIKATYIGNIRNYTERRGAQEVPAQAHQVALTVKLTDCGITMCDVWEVYFYRLETEWIFLDIMQVGSRQVTRTKKKHPPLKDDEIKKIITDAMTRANPDLRVRGITILGKKGSWRLCVPEFRVTVKIHADLEKIIYNSATAYECLMISTLAHENGKWDQVKISCMYKEQETDDCHIGTMCRELGTVSTVPPVSDDEAARILRNAFGNEYGLKKNNVVVEKFEIIKKDPAENFGTKAPYTVQALFVIDENKIIPGDDYTPRRTEKVRAVYECVVSGYLNYSLSEKKWDGIIESCCPSVTERCGTSCSDTARGCRRLGEK